MMTVRSDETAWGHVNASGNKDHPQPPSTTNRQHTHRSNAHRPCAAQANTKRAVPRCRTDGPVSGVDDFLTHKKQLKPDPAVASPWCSRMPRRRTVSGERVGCLSLMGGCGIVRAVSARRVAVCPFSLRSRLCLCCPHHLFVSQRRVSLLRERWPTLCLTHGRCAVVQI